MKITNGHQHYLNAVRTNQKTVGSSQPAQEEIKTAKQPSVSIEISEEAKKLSEQMQNAAPSERAEQIRKAIQNGSYQVSPEKIAAKMLDAMKTQREE